MNGKNFSACYRRNNIILTEGSVGLRALKEFGQAPDKYIGYSALIYTPDGRKALEKIYGQYLQAAEEFSLPVLLMTNTRRFNRERLANSRFSDKNIISDYALFIREIAEKYKCEVYTGGITGCKGDAYTGEETLPEKYAEKFHSFQIKKFAEAGIDFIFAAIMPAVGEAAGMAKAASASGLPYIISFTVKQNGKLPDGTFINDAIKYIDNITEIKPLCYMSNCVHPKILFEALDRPENNTPLVKERFNGIQANGSDLPPEILDSSDILQTSGATGLAEDIITLHKKFPMKIFGGCCGTDQTHIREMAKKLISL